jgi:hypothetical protein
VLRVAFDRQRGALPSSNGARRIVAALAVPLLSAWIVATFF